MDRADLSPSKRPVLVGLGILLGIAVVIACGTVFSPRGVLVGVVAVGRELAGGGQTRDGV